MLNNTGENNMRKTKPLYITEEESLILWELLKKQYWSSQQEFSHNEITKLFAKVIHKSCSFAGTLDEGETVKTIYEGMM